MELGHSLLLLGTAVIFYTLGVIYMRSTSAAVEKEPLCL